VQLVDPARASPDRLKALGAAGVVKVSNNLQAIFGTRSENLKSDMEAYLRSTGADLAAAPTAAIAEAVAPRRASVPDPDVVRAAAPIVAALGGASNIVSVEACALTRVRVTVADPARVDETALGRAGIPAVMRLDDSVLHLVVGSKAEAMAAAIASRSAKASPERTTLA
jgi:PTS system glucose-specific IIC component